MLQGKTNALRKCFLAAAAMAAACALMMSCAAPAYARTDEEWDEMGDVRRGEASVTAYTGGDSSGTGNYGDTGTGSGSQDESSDEDRDRDESSGGNSSSDKSDENDASAERGFTTPGNGNLGDEIRNSNGKDFFTVRTKNNNTFYLVIDHENSTENVYMLSLIDENDLAEFLEEKEEKKETSAAPVILPETKPKTEETETEKKEETQQPQKAPFENVFTWGLITVAAAGLAIYYFKFYKPGHEEEEDESEGMENMDDGLPTEREE